MSAVVKPAHWQWPADVLSVAEAERCTAWLEPVLQISRKLFGALNLDVLLETDPEIRDDSHITFIARVPGWSASQIKDAQDAWVRQLMDVCPPPFTCLFRLRFEASA